MKILENINKNKFIVIADDFTGSNDCGVQFKNKGLSTITILDKEDLELYKSYDVVVIDTESRNMNEDDAYSTIEDIGKYLKFYFNDYNIFKKIDSTLRGNIESEIRALDKALEPDLIAFIPAYPKNKRTMYKGIQYINEVPIDKTDMVNDPKHPVTTSNVTELLNCKSNMEFTHVDLEIIRNDDIPKKIKTSKSNKFSFDAIVDSDIDIIIRSLLQLNKKVLWVGSAGLSNSLVNTIGASTNTNNRLIVSIIGSINSVSALQAKRALNLYNIHGIKIDINNLVSNPEDEKRRILNEAIYNMNCGRDIIIASALDGDQVIMSSNLANNLDMELNQVSNIIAEFLGNIACDILNNGNVSGLFLTGGDTAINVIKRLGAYGSNVENEIESGVPHIKIVGGKYEGLDVVTKAGGFGDEETLINSIKYLKNLYRKKD
jgi:uncharacterized protein YgbK (DUF1537 family)